MAVKGIILREWDYNPYSTENFKLVTKFTDLGSPDTKKKIYGFYCNVSFNPLAKTEYSADPFLQDTLHVAYLFTVFYRDNPDSQWTVLGEVKNNFKTKRHVSFKNKLNNVYYSQDIVSVANVQLKIESNLINGGFGINDFGLIYRSLRTTSVEKHDES